MQMKRREFVGSLGIGLAGIDLAMAQGAQPGRPAPADSAYLQSLGEAFRPKVRPVQQRKVKTTVLFKSPEKSPNDVAIVPEGVWVADQRSNHALLMDWNGKVLKTVTTESKNTSGMGVGGGYIWMCANMAPYGVYQTDMNSKTVSHRQIPLGPADNGGGCHGAEYVDGKLWLAALRPRGILRVDVKTWQPEFLIPYAIPRAHGIAFDRAANAWWMVTGDEKGVAGIIKYDAATGQALEAAPFAATDADPHGLAWHDGALYSCDAGIHPGWPDEQSPTSSQIFRIDVI
jgi:hypothetical protein